MSHLRPRTAVLTLALLADDDVDRSDLTLTTRDGEMIWRGQVSPDALHAGLRLRARWRGTWEDAQWAMALATLDGELATHGLRRDGDPRVDLTRADAGGTLLGVACRVVPCRLLVPPAGVGRPQRVLQA